MKDAARLAVELLTLAAAPSTVILSVATIHLKYRRIYFLQPLNLWFAVELGKRPPFV